MNIIFVSGLYRNDIQSEINKKSKKMPYFAANTHQWALVNGLEMVNPGRVRILNAMHLKSYPSYEDVYIKGGEWTHNDKISNEDVGYLNIFGLKHFWKTINLYLKLKRMLNDYPDEKVVVITYGIHTPFLLAAYLNLKRIKNSSVKWCSIIPEIPLHYIGSKERGPIYNFLKGIDWKISLNLTRKSDMFQVLTEEMVSLMKIQDKPYILIEGIFDKNQHIKSKTEQLEEMKKNNNKIVLYTGTTSKRFGILELIETFTNIQDPNYRLVICGTGSGDEDIKKYIEFDQRIIWKGFLPRESILKMQEEADVLVNPRMPDHEFTKYSFPSKTMEYLYSGTPVLMHKLQGIPDEYDRYINWFENTNYEDMAQQIVEIASWTDVQKKAYKEKVQKFIEINKSVDNQGKRFYEFLLDN